MAKTEKGKNPVLFLDRDGTINVDIGPLYISHPEQAKLIPGAGQAIVKARAEGFRVAIITNQAGVAKGKTPKEALPVVHAHLEKLIADAAGVAEFAFDDVRVCIHHPDEKCRCRKPETQLLEESIKKLDADPARSFFVGDKSSDLICAARMGVRSILVLTGHGMETEAECRDSTEARPMGVVPTLTEAVELAIRLRDKLA
ncbi:MAG: HAD family hydrolase [Deltaproteobacteria bacterium]|nr:HAD family hydrolase [Deltaproteobacteria bacterium]